jgi:hypothetical protein
MTALTRLDPIGDRGTLAWFYAIPHQGPWIQLRQPAVDAGYSITEECQTLVDPELGGCLRYLLVRQRSA